MEQKSNITYRAEKLYKHSREKFSYLIREVVSNAIHSTIIRTNAETDVIPRVEFSIELNDNEIIIIIKDNGDGFTEHNSIYFTHLDEPNPQKKDLMFNPMGQGRLAIVFYSDDAEYKSVFKEKDGTYKEKIFKYPNEGQSSLFDIEEKEGYNTNKRINETILTLIINKQQTFKRANTFFKQYSTADKLRNWFIDNFFPFFIDIKNLELHITFNGESKLLDNSYIENNVKSIDFTVDFEDKDLGTKDFNLWLLKKDNSSPKIKNKIKCYARQLKAEIDIAKIEYEINLNESYDFLLLSSYFDESVDQKGDKIEIEEENIEKIQTILNEKLSSFFYKEIEKNKKLSMKNFKSVKNKYPSLSTFTDEFKVKQTKKILTESDILSTALENKGKAEKNYWTKDKTDSSENEKLLNSSLYIYIEHRRRILEKLKELIKKFDNEGNKKSELEDEIHDLIFRRGEKITESDNINHLHNLWILDDKFTVFSEARNGQSTNKGQEATDIYLWMNDKERPKELLILELKSTTHSHNTGDKYESMLAQVKRYATKFYDNPEKIINWSVDTGSILYSGIILARKSDILKELNSNNIAGKPNKIPFLECSYFFNEEFSISKNCYNEPEYKKIRIEMYAYEDILHLSQDRNEIFFKLLNSELEIDYNNLE
ncbi:hypothetical protein [Halarcobacter sp.]|uniref:hypothetical protein n=1 Tax=Halarcobacter sp. TaxID=2321133 RepID=UPI002AA6CA42|nr:hypothetical protein [Halarcobacter sp.]